jgi:pyruvate dehydrogenase E2 component (dihydrolipoamide acetyltransferase)
VSNTIEIKVPDIGDFDEVPVIEVLVAEGDEVSEEQSLITLESDKATMEVPSPAAGRITELRVALNDTVSQGDVVAVIETKEEAESGDSAEEEAEAEPQTGDSEEADQARDDSEESESEEPAGEKPQKTEVETSEAEPASRPEPPATGLEAVDPSTVPYASPAIRKFARELGVDLAKVSGTGQGGRIVREDVSGFVKSALKQPGKGSGLPFDLPPPPKIDFSKYGETERVELSKIRRMSAANLHRNWLTIPHVTHHDEADITDMEAFRKSSAAEAESQGFKLTPLVFLIKASVAALRKFPDFNASLGPSGDHLILKKYFNIGIAVDTPQGLVVPVLRNCQSKGIMELARELGEVSEKARDGKLSPAEMSGACFSISSLGGIGGTGFSPIINLPEVAILGVSRHKMRPVWDGEAFKPRLILPLSLSYDHRVIDGASAARFTRYLASRLEDLRRLTL